MATPGFDVWVTAGPVPPDGRVKSNCRGPWSVFTCRAIGTAAPHAAVGSSSALYGVVLAPLVPLERSGYARRAGFGVTRAVGA
jgi:hypothetical protein